MLSWVMCPGYPPLKLRVEISLLSLWLYSVGTQYMMQSVKSSCHGTLWGNRNFWFNTDFLIHRQDVPCSGVCVLKLLLHSEVSLQVLDRSRIPERWMLMSALSWLKIYTPAFYLVFARLQTPDCFCISSGIPHLYSDMWNLEEGLVLTGTGSN